MFSIDISSSNKRFYHIYGHNTGVSYGLSDFVYSYQMHDLIGAECIIEGKVVHNRKKSITYLFDLIIDSIINIENYDVISKESKDGIMIEIKINGSSIIFISFQYVDNYFSYSFNDIHRKIAKSDVVYCDTSIDDINKDILNKIKLVLDVIK